MAGDALATMNCTVCDKPGAQVKKQKNSVLLYLSCSCGCHRSSAEKFQKKLREAVSGITETLSEENPEISEDDPGEWKPTIATQTAKNVAIPENQPTPSAAAPTTKSLKKIAGFALFALGAAGLAFKALR